MSGCRYGSPMGGVASPAPATFPSTAIASSGPSDEALAAIAIRLCEERGQLLGELGVAELVNLREAALAVAQTLLGGLP